MKTLTNTRTGNNATRKADYHIVEVAGRFKVYDGAGRFRLTFGTREAAQQYIDGKHAIDGHTTFQVAVAALVIAFLLFYPATARAYPMACRNIPHGQICRSSIDGMRTGRCDRGYEMKPNWTCQRIQVQP